MGVEVGDLVWDIGLGESKLGSWCGKSVWGSPIVEGGLGESQLGC